MKNERYLKQGETKMLSNREELKEYLDFRKDNDVWSFPYMASDLGVVGLNNYPLLLPGLCKNVVIKKSHFELKSGDIDYESEEAVECLESTGLFVAFPLEGKMCTLPTSSNAFTNILMRTDDYCGTMTRMEPKANKKVLPIEEKAARLNRDMELHGDICRILYRDKKVQAVLSKEYVILPVDELIGVLEDVLSKDHPDIKFTDGMISEEYLVARYELNSRGIEEELRLKLNDLGSNINTLKACVQFSTSDIGMSSVSADVFFECDGVKIFLSSIKMPHKGTDTSVDLFRDKLEDFGNALKESEEQIERLGNIELNDVPLVVEKITSHYSSVFPEKITREVIDELKLTFKSGGTAIDAYMALNDIIDRHASTNDLSPSRYLQLTEQVGKMMKLPYDRIESDDHIWHI